jgi:hypothetical protein
VGYLVLFIDDRAILLLEKGILARHPLGIEFEV